MRSGLALPLLMLLGGCAATFEDRHHFATVNSATGQVVNVFRVKVTGGAEMANARYIAGHYDPRAVDLFFNEVGARDLTADESKGAVPSIFRTTVCSDPADEACKKKQDEALRTVPIGGSADKEGRFVMILSTNANAVASAIGGFAENEVVLGSALYLATKGDRETVARIEAEAPILTARRRAVRDEIGKILDGSDPNKYLRVLQAVAAGLAPEAAPQFSDEKEAKAWFSARPRGVQP